MTLRSKSKYEKYILQHSGIRLIESELFNGYDPEKEELMQEILWNKIWNLLKLVKKWLWSSGVNKADKVRDF